MYTCVILEPKTLISTLNNVGKNISKNYITFHGIVLWNPLSMHLKLLASLALFKIVIN